MTDASVPVTQPGDPPPVRESETTELLDATMLDGADVPDTSDGVPQDHTPMEGAPS
jgi:hypothetical protein